MNFRSRRLNLAMSWFFGGLCAGLLGLAAFTLSPPKPVGTVAGTVSRIDIPQGDLTGPHRIRLLITLTDGRSGSLFAASPLSGLKVGDRICLRAATRWIGSALQFWPLPDSQCPELEVQG